VVTTNFYVKVMESGTRWRGGTNEPKLERIWCIGARDTSEFELGVCHSIKSV